MPSRHLVRPSHFFKRGDQPDLPPRQAKAIPSFYCDATSDPLLFFAKPLRDFASHPQFLGICLIATAMILFSGERWKVPTDKRDDDVKAADQRCPLDRGDAVRCAHSRHLAQRLDDFMRQSPRMGGAKERSAFLFCFPFPRSSAATVWSCSKFICPMKCHLAFPSLLVLSVSSLPLFLDFSSCRFALSYLERGNLKPFAWYCLGFGMIVTVFLNFVGVHNGKRICSKEKKCACLQKAKD